MASVGSLTVDLIAQTASFNANISKAAANLNSQTAQMNRSLQAVQKRLDSFSSGAAALRDTFLTYQVGQFIGEQFKFAASLGETAQQLGVTTKQLQVYNAMAGQVGIEQEDMERGLAKLTVSLGQAALGAEKPGKAFDALGISVRDSNGHVKTAGDALPEIANKLAKITEPAQRAAAEVALFGKAGQRLDNILTGGQSGIDAYTKQLQDTGQILSDDLINKADTAADRIEALNRQLKVSVARVVAENADAILSLANALATATGRALQFISNYPRLTAALAGAAAGARVGGVPGAIIGAGVGFAGTTFYQQNSSMDIDTRARELSKATEQVNRMVARGAGKSNRAGLNQQLNELHRQQGLLEQARRLAAPTPAPTLPPVLAGEDLPDFLKPSGGSHKKAPADRTDQNIRQYQDQLARLNDDLLSAKRDNVVDAGQLADLARQQVQVEVDKLNADITEMAAKNPILAAHQEELRSLVAQAAAQKQLTISSEQLAHENDNLLEVQLAANDNQKDLLQAQHSIATSASERLPIALRLLELDKDEERLKLQAIVDRAKIGQATAAEAQAAQGRLGQLDQIYAERAAVTRRDNEGPLQAYIRDAHKTGAEMNEALQGIAANGLQSFSDGLADALVNFKSLGDVAKNVLAQIAADFLKLSLQRGISSLFSSLLGGIGGGGKAGMKLAGARAGGGPVGAGLAYLVGEEGPEIMVPDASGSIIPNHRLSTPSFAPRPPSVLQIVPSPYFDVVVDGRIQSAAPAMVSLGAAETQTRLARSASRRVA